MGIFLVCSKVCSEQFTFIGFYGLLQCDLKKVKKSCPLGPTKVVREEIRKLLYLALRNICQKWYMSIRDWKAALNRFSIEFEDRVPQQ